MSPCRLPDRIVVVDLCLQLAAEWRGCCGDKGSLSARTSGQARPLHQMTAHCIYLIASEALRNAARHSGSPVLELTVEFSAEALEVTIRDFGRGMEGPAGPGLTGMRQRALQLGALLQISSDPHSGTAVRVSVPAARAYASEPSPTGGWQRWWKACARLLARHRVHSRPVGQAM
ncbi:MAG: ATP-binding protein [Steroidobacteraceae bacterium]